MKQIVPIVLTALMLTSVFAAMDFADELKDTNEMETGGRAADELVMHDVLEPRETFVDQSGNTRNGIDIGDVVHFRPIVINDGDNDADEFNIRVVVTPAGTTTPIIDNLDDAVCPGDVAVTGCSFNTLPSGDFLGGGNYRVQAASGGDLTWTPSIAGEYTVTVSLDLVSNDDDGDLTNNEISYSVTVQHYRDIAVDLCWTVSAGGECMADDAAYANAQGAGPHNFALTVVAQGSEEWQPRATTLDLSITGSIDEVQTQFDSSPCASDSNCDFSVVVGETQSVDVYHNLTGDQTDSSQENPCANAANPCAQDRTVMNFDTEYVFHGTVVGDENVAGGSGLESLAISVNLVSYTDYEMTETTYEDPNDPENGTTTSQIMMEMVADYDDRTGNNDGALAMYWGVFHDVGLTSLTAGMNDATEGTLNVGTNRLKAGIVYGGSSATNTYDWEVTFSVKDENMVEMIPQGSESANECLDENPDLDAPHLLLGEAAEGAAPEGTACIEVDLGPGRYTVTATAHLIDTTIGGDPADDCGTGSNDACMVDMNSGNDMRATFFELINDNPTVFTTLDSINRDGEQVDAPVIVGDEIIMRARGLDTEDSEEQLVYEWKRMTADSEEEILEMCAMSICTAQTDASWIGEHRVTATVTDSYGASDTDSMMLSVWNIYTHTHTDSADMVVTGATLSYSLVYGPATEVNASASSVDAYTEQALGNNAGSFDSVLAFDLTVTNVFMPSDIGTESLTIDFAGDATVPYGLWYKRTADSAWTSLTTTVTAAAAGGVAMTYTHDGSLSGNLNGGTYAVFETSSAGGDPPATGISGLTAVAKPGAAVEFSWGLSDEGMEGSNDLVHVYYCTGADCDPLTGTAMPGQAITTTSWTNQFAHDDIVRVTVRVENGNTDASGNTLFGSPAATLEVTADGSVSPAPTISDATATLSGDSLTFTWSATEGDVSSWVLCWAGTQSIVEDEFSSISEDGCDTTEDTTKSITVDEQKICGGTCNAEIYFGIAAKDSVGNVADPGALLYQDMKDGLNIPDVIDGGGTTDPTGEDGMPSQAIYAIIGLVVIAVIGGAFILTRGGGGEGGNEEWDY